jgi:hypothetical protein
MNIDIQTAKGNTNRLTIAPDRVTVKVVKDMTATSRKQLLAFVEYVLEQFVEIKETWRGSVHFELSGVQHITSRLQNQSGEKFRKYEVVF